MSAFSLATADAITKKFLSARNPATLVRFRFVFTAVILAPVLFMQPWPELQPGFFLWLLALIPVEIGAMLLYMRAISTSPLSRTVPYLAFTPVLTTVTGLVLLGEAVTPAGLLGILLVVAGAWLLNAERVDGESRTWITPFRNMIRDPGSRDMLIVAMLYSLTSVLGKGALQYVPPTFFGPFYFFVLGAVVLVVVRTREGPGDWHLFRQPVAGLMLGLAMAAMVVTHFIAIEQVEVSYMIAVKRTSLLFGILYGVLIFGEKGFVRNIAAGSIMVAGVFVLSQQS